MTYHGELIYNYINIYYFCMRKIITQLETGTMIGAIMTTNLSDRLKQY